MTVILAPEIIGKAQILGENALNTIIATDNCAVTHTMLAQTGPKHRLSVVDYFPVEAVPAQAKIYLLPIRSGFFPKMDE